MTSPSEYAGMTTEALEDLMMWLSDCEVRDGDDYAREIIEIADELESRKKP